MVKPTDAFVFLLGCVAISVVIWFSSVVYRAVVYRAVVDSTESEHEAKISAKYETWSAGIVSHRIYTDSYRVDENGFVVFTDLRTLVTVAMPPEQVHVIRQIQN